MSKMKIVNVQQQLFDGMPDLSNSYTVVQVAFMARIICYELS